MSEVDEMQLTYVNESAFIVAENAAQVDVPSRKLIDPRIISFATVKSHAACFDRSMR